VSDSAWRGLHRFYVETPLAVGATVSVDALGRQLAGVLRLAPGAQVVLFDGSGAEFRAELVTLSARQAAAQIVAARPCPAEPTFFLTLFQCTLKQDKFEWVLQKGTELGVACIVPVISQRSVVRPADEFQPDKRHNRTNTYRRKRRCRRPSPAASPAAPALGSPAAVRRPFMPLRRMRSISATACASVTTGV
jgi:16S rRNA (uracil1498-N3)-methyltransferase